MFTMIKLLLLSIGTVVLPHVCRLLKHNNIYIKRQNT